jgi:hypothetical protein
MEPAEGSDLRDLRAALSATRARGGLVAFILGAGCSLSAGIPGMRDVYRYLSERIAPLAHDPNHATSTRDQLQMLGAWLDALSKGNTSRSLAARALGVLQRSFELRDQSLSQILSDVWENFAVAFLAGTIDPTKKPILEAIPTTFHRFVAECALSEVALPLSVNFDGLTHRAIAESAKGQGLTAEAVILSDASQLERFALGERRGTRLVPVVKIWGDVFHAVCRRRQCPKFGLPVPIYALAPTPASAAQLATSLLECPECRSKRQLQIYFAGYEEKERVTHNLVEAFYRYYGNRVTTIVIAGLSGEWDDLLIHLVQNLASTRSQSAGQPGRDAERAPFVFCIDPAKSFLIDELTRVGVRVAHLNAPGGADAVGESLIGWSNTSQPSTEPLPLADVSGQPDHIWIEPIARKVRFPTILKELAIDNGVYLDDMRRLRQLGLKTRMINLDPDQESNHNRYIHSRGAAFIGSYWIDKIIEKMPSRFSYLTNALRATVPLALINHDIGHVPFTHLSEEMFHEVNWSTRPWSQRFRHDDNALDRAWPPLRAQWEALCDKLTPSLGYPIGHIVRDTINGASGIHFMDAIVNSPLDSDKIDYIYRDCIVTNQALHLPGIGIGEEKKRERMTWLEEFFDEQVILESGVIGLRGKSGHHAAQLLEERLWLYKNVYLLPQYRVVERLARHILLMWLLGKVEGAMRTNLWAPSDTQEPFLLGDTRFLKGCAARDLLWDQLRPLQGGEPDLLLKITRELTESESWTSSQKRGWILSSEKVFKRTLTESNTASATLRGTTYDALERVATWSQRIYCRQNDGPKIEEVARELEVKNPYTVLFDIASLPRALSYPDSRRHTLGHSRIISDCFAVPHPDPDRWHHSTGYWIPLSQSRFSDRDDERYAQIIILSPSPNDEANVHHFEDRLRNMCRHAHIELFDAEPPIRIA